MSNGHADKARAFLDRAEAEHKVLERRREEARSGEGRPMKYEEEVLHLLETSTFISAAQVHATLATVPESEVFDAPPPSDEPLPEDEPEPDPTAEVFAALDDTISFMRSVSPLFQYFAGRTAKDTPQA